MTQLGIPLAIVTAWTMSLDRMVRFPTLNGLVGQGFFSTSGVPEGCSISVLSMLGTSAFFLLWNLQPTGFSFCLCGQLEF